MADLKVFAEQLVNLTVKEVNELAEILKNEYGIDTYARTYVPAVQVSGYEEYFEIQKDNHRNYRDV
ncbi:MAG: hypothetical protein J6U79_04700, partial [Paludibacteraceae bacterium]|nr:hypothetical protein [Paludibacteraceae bacterium]